jgi:hypothetical protein
LTGRSPLSPEHHVNGRGSSGEGERPFRLKIQREVGSRRPIRLRIRSRGGIG